VLTSEANRQGSVPKTAAGTPKMSVRANVLREEIRLQAQRLRRVPVARLKAEIEPYRRHGLTRAGDAGRVFDFIAGLTPGPGGTAVAHRQMAAKIAEDSRHTNYEETLMWLSELEGTVNRAPDPMSDESAAALRSTLNYIRAHISEFEAQAR
jgi:hypothetical protein